MVLAVKYVQVVGLSSCILRLCPLVVSLLLPTFTKDLHLEDNGNLLVDIAARGVLAWFIELEKGIGLRSVAYLPFAQTPILLLKVAVVEFTLLIFEGQLDKIGRLDSL